MLDLANPKQQLEQPLLTSILDLAHADDGDLAAINQLAKTSNDEESFRLVMQRLCAHPQGKSAFESRFSLGDIDLEELRKLPDDTLGHVYAEHMIENKLQPLRSQIAESDQNFLGMHITETHDIWHVVTGSNTDILGEIQLEAFCIEQLGASRFWLGLLTKNLLKSLLYDIESSAQYMEALTRGWLMGKRAKPLFGINWNNLWETPIEQVRASLNIDRHVG